MKEKLSMLKELWLYALVRRRFFLAGVFVFLLFLSLLIAIAETPALLPFIYPLF